MDNIEAYTFTAYSDDGITQLGDPLVITSGDPDTGDGRATPWSFERPTNDIRQVRIHATGKPSQEALLDNITSSYTQQQQQKPASMALQMYAGVKIEGDVGRPYGIEYTESVEGTNWKALTNLFLPSSPYLFLDVTSTNSARRFYRVVNLP